MLNVFKVTKKNTSVKSLEVVLQSLLLTLNMFIKNSTKLNDLLMEQVIILIEQSVEVVLVLTLDLQLIFRLFMGNEALYEIWAYS